MDDTDAVKADAPLAAGDRLAYSIDMLAEATTISKSGIYREIEERKLIARSIRGRTVVLADDAKAWLAALPPLTLRRGGAVLAD